MRLSRPLFLFSDAEGPFLLLHLLRPFVRRVVVAEKVEDSVHGQQRQLVVQGDGMDGRLPVRGLHGYDYVAQSLPRVVGFGEEWRAGNVVALRKGEHVRGLVLAAVVAVQLVNRGVVGEKEADLGVGSAFSPKRVLAGEKERGRADGYRLRVQNSDRHGRLF